MSETLTEVKNLLNGGEFLVKSSNFQDVFTPEDLNEEQLMIVDTVKSFVETEITPIYDRIEHQEPGLTESLLAKAGELGLLGLAIPEEYGGMGKDFNTNSLLVENLAKSRSFSLSLGAHIGIGTLPIVYFGNEQQKTHYLPKLASGELKACYCLTEPSSGSDALGAKTVAILNEEGTHYIVNGQKMWITNSGFADVFIVFCQIGGHKFSCLILEKDMPGLTLGAEEKKMGIKGSSTRQVFLENVKVPKENLLGEIGKGHLIAFNILNIGRYKLAAGVLGGSKSALEQSLKYAEERQQFKTPISNFGAIQYKLAEMTTRIYALQSACYRASDMIDNKEKELVAQGKPYQEAIMMAAEEYAIECSLLKFIGSEVLDYCVDENVQIHGGMGYSEELAAAGAYRDARINRIFEGTNEINRLLSVDMLLKRAMSGKIDMMTPALAVQKELMSVPDFSANEDNEPLAAELKAVQNAKKAILMTAGAAVQKLMKQLKNEQEILMNIADMLAEVYALESTVLRTQKLIANNGEAAVAVQIDMTKIAISDGMERINLYGKHALQAFGEGDELRIMLMGLKRYTKYDIVNTKEARRRVAAKVLEANTYCF
ncbi:MAG TPA: acyl-CoA dehydrogenase family protein [Chitinophagales bacterium]|nr:acyl-CoA dehydrogenase family protein [Chitinophagales bacterium]HMX61382.1 acyl-CoA dehydrogenase family protein [Chitinophagales bacterium]HMZ33940.1 acyl-CoA dehydrogenase family protein [Chitinophagales bacterium]HNB49608.1 acyl-CoA dehydrogenase family protein [Chitinophagales bacterium]HND83369.1 acyl-CoA dehydrogenase family protein [Chitinophagales bacterium]